MLKSQSCLVKMSEVREELNALPDDVDTEKLNELTKRYQSLEAQYRAALIVEGEEKAAETPPEDGQPAELRGLIRRSSLATFLIGAADESNPKGAEKELRAAVFGEDDRPDLIPLDLLLPASAEGRTEDRADAVSSQTTALAGKSGGNHCPRVRGDGCGLRWRGDAYRCVGQANYPVLTAGTTADVSQPWRSQGLGRGDAGRQECAARPGDGPLSLEYGKRRLSPGL